MIVADTSVWIDYFNARATSEAEQLDRLLEADCEETLCLTGLILAEILRGVASDREEARVYGELVALPLLDLAAPADHIEAARLYRRARSSGVTVRSTVDVLIASTCIKYDACLLHRDRDFDHLATVSELKIWNSPA